MSFFNQITNQINLFFESINNFLSQIFFFDILFFIEGKSFPLVVFVLFACGIFFTFRMGFVNVRLFWHSIKITFGLSGKEQKKEGDISHFKALTTALSATVGLGNIAGVAIAVSVGGPGAAFWMLVMGFLGMSTKFTECTLALMYREKREDRRIMGGPMEYLRNGLSQMGWPRLGKTLSVIFCIFCIGGSFGGGVAFQVNQSLSAIAISLPILEDFKWLYALVLMILVATVIIGGIKRIADVSGRIVPLMFVVYMSMALVVLVAYSDQVVQALSLIFTSAWSPSAGYGGFVGVLVTGLQRAAFSNEAGLGSSPIAHSAAKVSHPVEEGVVAILEPFLDTVVICTTTALLILVTGVHELPEYAELVSQKQGAALTSQALSQVHSFFPYILSLAVFLFAFSTIIAWSYYGERCFSFLFGEKYSLIYKIGVLIVIFLGAMAASPHILNFCDLMILSMAFPNLIGVLLLNNKVRAALKEYIAGLKQAS